MSSARITALILALAVALIVALVFLRDDGDVQHPTERAEPESVEPVVPAVRPDGSTVTEAGEAGQAVDSDDEIVVEEPQLEDPSVSADERVDDLLRGPVSEVTTIDPADYEEARRAAAAIGAVGVDASSPEASPGGIASPTTDDDFPGPGPFGDRPDLTPRNETGPGFGPDDVDVVTLGPGEGEIDIDTAGPGANDPGVDGTGPGEDDPESDDMGPGGDESQN